MASTQVSPPKEEKSLTAENNLPLWTFIGINLAVFLSILATRGFSGASVDELWKRVTTKDGIIAAGIPILTIVLRGLFSEEMQARLVFWRWRNPLPGSRVFTDLIKTDPRIDVPALKQKLGEFPTEPAAQNALWYDVYKKHSEDLTVSQAHKFFLLTRDMTSSSVIFFFLLTFGLALDSVGWRTLAVYSAILCFQYALIATAARNYGNRFVLNVLTEESHSG